MKAEVCDSYMRMPSDAAGSVASPGLVLPVRRFTPHAVSTIRRTGS